MMKRTLKAVAAASVLFLAGGAANAALVATIEGSDCSGVFGQGFDNCVIPAQYDDNETPVIAKWDFDEAVWTINSLFPSVDGSEFAWTFGDDEGTSGTWTYTPNDDDDPAITFYVAKAGNSFNLFSVDGDGLSGDWVTPDRQGLSHLTWYDTDGTTIIEVPEPASLALVGLGLLGAGFASRRRNRG